MVKNNADRCLLDIASAVILLLELRLKWSFNLVFFRQPMPMFSNPLKRDERLQRA